MLKKYEWTSFILAMWVVRQEIVLINSKNTKSHQFWGKIFWYFPYLNKHIDKRHLSDSNRTRNDSNKFKIKNGHHLFVDTFWGKKF